MLIKKEKKFNFPSFSVLLHLQEAVLERSKREIDVLRKTAPGGQS